MRFASVIAIASLAALIPVGLSAAGSFDEGERLFREDKPAEAASVLEKAILETGTDERAWLYLALSYQQLGRLDEAAAVLRKGLDQAVRFKSLYLFRPRQYLRTSRTRTPSLPICSPKPSASTAL